MREGGLQCAPVPRPPPPKQTLPAFSGALLASLLVPPRLPTPPPGLCAGPVDPRTGVLWIPSGPPRAPVRWNKELAGLENNRDNNRSL